MSQVATTSNPVASFSKFLDKYKPQMALALPKHLNPDRMARLAVTEFAKNEKLQQCAPESIIGSIMTASTLGLEIGVNGQGFLVPYGRTATFVPGWKGLVDLVTRSGRATVWTGAVFEGDDFDYALGDSPFVRHRPGDEDDPAKLTHVYAIGRANGSEVPVIEVWTIKKVWKHRDKYNKVGKSHYSFRDPEMYARKVPLLQVLKYMPCSIEVQRAIEVANLAEEGRSVIIDGDFISSSSIDTGNAPESAGQSRTESVKDKLRGQGKGAPIDTETGEVIDPQDAELRTVEQAGKLQAPEVTYAQVAEKLNRANDQDELDAAADLIQYVGNVTQREELGGVYKQKAAEFKAK